MKTTYEEELSRTGSFTYTCSGVSMLPLLRQKKDLFTITKKQGRCKKYDVVLYKRYIKTAESCKTAYVLHRVIEVRENDYVILGDNCLNKEYGISEEDIIGVMTAFVRNGKEYSVENKAYRMYAVVWYYLYPLRRLWKKCRISVRKMLNIRNKEDDK